MFFRGRQTFLGTPRSKNTLDQRALARMMLRLAVTFLYKYWHILIIPNKKIQSLNDIVEDDQLYLSKILLCAKNLAHKYNIAETGYRLITNCNRDGGQEIDYLHFHLVGGVKLGKMISLPKASKKILKNNI